MEEKKDDSAAPAAVAADALEQPTDPNAVANQSAINDTAGAPAAKKPGGIKAVFKKFNVYLLIFIFLVIIAGAVTIVSYLNNQKPPVTPSVATQQLSTDTLSQLANSDATVGGSGQTLTVQGNAIFSGQVLIRSDLNVAGTIKVGTGVIVPEITVSGKATLGDTQSNSLQVANNSVFQGSITAQKDLNVAGAASFSGPITAGQITVTKLILSGNAALQIPNHIAFTGASPGRTINAAALGSGGTASINGSDTSGTISINTGNSPSAGCFVTVTFNSAYTSTPHVLVTPIGSGAGQVGYYVNRSTTSFSICGNSAAPSNQQMGFDYFVTQS